MNENHIQKILAYEQQASNIYEAAVKEAEQLPALAEQEAEAMIAKARQQAEEEARALLSQAQTDAEVNRITEELAEKIKQTESLAKTHQEKAVGFVIARVIGMEQH